MGHRGGFSVGSAPTVAKARPGTTPVDPRHFRGFSYLLGEPDGASRTTIGADPEKARDILTALYSLLPNGRLEENTRIPAGYTYLLQFVAHDLVETTVPFWAAAEAGVPSRNMRDAMLRLDGLALAPSEYVRRNVWVTTSGLFAIAPVMCTVQVLGVDRVLFSVDYPFSSNAAGRKLLDTLPLSPADKAKIAGGNAERVLGLKPGPA